MPDRWKTRFELIRGFGVLALLGFLSCVCSAFVSEDYRRWPMIFGVLFCLPALLYIYVVVIWHWKERYRGSHSDLWGAIILIETTGWMKILYVFRHIVPDMRRSGRYR